MENDQFLMRNVRRPVYHFTPEANWLNDPNGMVYYAGEYHLFYQYHPGSTVWGPMHWGHAVSTDLVHWEDLPIALYPDALGAIFSGSAVIDWQNTAGFGAEALVTIFTYDAPTGQTQALAYSLDKGRSWTKYAENPVIPTPPGEKDFRDPKVFWYANGNGGGHWVLLLAVCDSIWFYTSPDLKQWHFASEFGEGYGSHAGVWETPDLFHLAVAQRPSETRWVLTVGIGAGGTVDEQGTQYFVGHFDGFTFTSENPQETLLRADAGPDFYAAQGWNDAPHGRKVWLAWMNNWIYANQIPTGEWRGAMSLPREVGLAATPSGLRLVQKPVAEMQTLRGHHATWAAQTLTPNQPLLLGSSQDAALEIVIDFVIDPTQPAQQFGLSIGVGDEQTIIGYATAAGQIFVDRTQAGRHDFSSAFAGVYRAPLWPVADTVRLHLFVDHTSVEVFGNDGVAVLTAQIFPTQAPPTVKLFTGGGPVQVRRLDLWQLVL